MPIFFFRGSQEVANTGRWIKIEHYSGAVEYIQSAHIRSQFKNVPEGSICWWEVKNKQYKVKVLGG